MPDVHVANILQNDIIGVDRTESATAIQLLGCAENTLFAAVGPRPEIGEANIVGRSVGPVTLPVRCLRAS